MSSLITPAQARRNQRDLLLKAYLSKKDQPRDLQAPQIPDALEPDNLLPKDVLLSGAKVLIPEWERPIEGDELTVFWNNAEIDKLVLGENQVFPYETQIKPELLMSEGTFPLHYTVMAASGSGSTSTVVWVKIDKTAPNQNNVPKALVFDSQVTNEGITPEYLAAHDDQVLATVSQYVDMQAGQVVHAFWSEVALEPVTLTEQDVSAKKVTVSIPGDLIRQTGEGTKLVDYYLTSRAGFDGLPSEASNVIVLLSSKPTELKAPKVPLAEDSDGIDLLDANTGVIIQIDAYQNATANDLIGAKWGNISLSPALVVPGQFPVLVSVPREAVINTGSGDVVVSYVVSRAGLSFNAPTLTVKVDIESVGPTDPDPSTPENEALLPAVLVSGNSLINELGPNDVGQSADVQIPYYTEVQVGDKISVYWGKSSATAALSWLVSAEEVAAESFGPRSLDAAVIAGTPDGPDWPLLYSLSQPLKPNNAVFAPVTLINVHMSVPGGLEGLPKVQFPDANGNGWLLTEHVENGAQLFVPVYENIKLGDVLTLNWMSYSNTNASPGSEIEGSHYSTSKTVAEPELANGISFVVPYEYIQPIAEVSPTLQGSGVASYVVKQNSIDTQAPDVLVKIELGHP